MKLCRDCPPGEWTTSFKVQVNRTNLCQWFWGFLRGWCRGEKEITLILQTSGSLNVIHKGERVYSSESEVEQL